MTAIGGGWKSRKKITITNSTTSQTNYPIMITVNRSAGTDTANTVYLGTSCNSDYSDIRFTNSALSLLPYWIEHPNTTSTSNIWVNCDSLPNGTATFYIYYGKPSATTTESGADTFTFFDDFGGSSIDAAKWTTSGSPSVSNSILSLPTGTNVVVSKIQTFGNNYSARYIFTPSFGGYGYYTFSNTDSSILTGIRYYDVNKCDVVTLKSGTWVTSSKVEHPSAITIGELKRTSAGMDYYVNNSLTPLNTNNTNIADNIGFRVYVEGGNLGSIDWVIIRPYISSEPTVTTWGIVERIIQSGVSLGSANMMVVG